MTDHRPTDQGELVPEIPSPGRLVKLRALIPMADAIIDHARAVEITQDAARPDRHLAPIGSIRFADIKACAGRRRALDRRLDALGLPLRGIALANFPEGTELAARTSGEFYVAIESACSALESVKAAELATIPRRPE